MKGIDIFCASQAATAICLSMEEPSSSSPSSATLLGHGGGSRSPAIDRYNPIITDSRRTTKPLPPNPQPPLIPKPHKNRHKKKNPKIPPKENGDQAKNSGSSTVVVKPEISKQCSINNGNANAINTTTNTAVVRKSWSCTKPSDFISPPGSTRYLLSEKAFFSSFSDFDPALNLFPAETSKSKAVKMNESFETKLPSSPASPDQVVVLRVSLHCRGCERKMRKHISRMEGVNSFNIDFAAKKVTVTGNVTPLEVLSSISKVKNAQLWSPTISSSTTPEINLSNAEFKNEFKGAGSWITNEGNFVGIAS